MTTLENYNGVSPETDKSTQNQVYQKEYMHHVGSVKARKATKDVSDGINGSLTLTNADLTAIDACSGSRLAILAEANGNQAQTEADIHNSGNSTTLPINARKELNLSPGDPIELWIELAEHSPNGESTAPASSKSNSDTSTSKDTTATPSPDRFGLRFSGGDKLHYVDNRDADKTQCGVPLAGREYSVSDEPPQAVLDILDTCPDCDLRASQQMSVQELVKWISTEAGFDPTDNNSRPNYFDKSMLVAIRERLLELKDTSTEN